MIPEGYWSDPSSTSDGGTSLSEEGHPRSADVIDKLNILYALGTDSQH